MAEETQNVSINHDQIGRAVDALLAYSLKKGGESFLGDDNNKIILQIGFKKIPQVKNQIVKIQLPHKIVDSGTEICLFVKDLKKNDKDHEATEQHFKDLLQEKGVTAVKSVVPLQCLKKEYQPHEAKKNLSDMYDCFLADERIVRHLPTFLGKHFYSRKRHPRQVNLQAKDLKTEIDRVLSYAQCIVSGRGPCCQVTVSDCSHKREEIIGNLKSALENLLKKLPGGVQNIKTYHIKTPASPSLPIYVSHGSPNDVILPVKKKKETHEKDEEVTTVIHGKVRVSEKGNVAIMNASNMTDEEKLVLAKRRKALKKLKKAKAKAKKLAEAVDRTLTPEEIKKREIELTKTETLPKKKKNKKRKLSQSELSKQDSDVEVHESGMPVNKKKKSDNEENFNNSSSAKRKVKSSKFETPKQNSKENKNTSTDDTPKIKKSVSQDVPSRVKTPKVQTIILSADKGKTPTSTRKDKSQKKTLTPKSAKSGTPLSSRKTPKVKKMTPT